MTLKNKLDIAQKKIAELEKQRDEWMNVRLVQAGPDGKGGFEITMTAAQELIARIAEAGFTILGDTPNYVEMTFSSALAKKEILLTLQRKEGKTPSQLQKATELRVKELEAELLARTESAKWEADHQRNALFHIGGQALVDEFPWGCDAIEHVAEALLAVRKHRDQLRAENLELKGSERH